MRLMAVDDERIALLELESAIRSAKPDAELCAFDSAAEALDFAGKNRVDTAFLDISMRETDGITLAKGLKARNPQVNIIFVTGYDAYWQEAIRLHCSGYLLKPVTEKKVQEALSDLLYPEQHHEHLYARTFGSFDLLVDGKPLVFQRDRAKELLACLIDRGGSSVSKRELAALLFEDARYSREQQQYFTKIYGFLIKSLQTVHAESLLIKQHNSYAVDTSLLRCDAWDYQKGDPEAINAFCGEYMNQYSWAETSLSRFFL